MRLDNNSPSPAGFRSTCARAARVTLALVCAAAVALSLFVRARYHAAATTLEGIDLRARNVSGPVFYADKKRLFVGQQLSRTDVVGHLESIHFSRADRPGVPGTYVVEGTDALRVTPRLAEFQPATVTFRRGRIARISVEPTELLPTAGDVPETTLEPVTLGSFVVTIKDRPSAPMFVRRHTVQPQDVLGTDLFYAILASEDATFMSHNGVRYGRLLASLVRQLQGRPGGGSTLTAQVVKNAVSLDASRRYSRKLDELFMSVALERKMTKEEIFTLYVNNVFLGAPKNSVSLYGFLAAAEAYFGKTRLGDLTLNEACTLVAIVPKPQDLVRAAGRGDYSELTVLRDRVLHWLGENWPDRYPPELVERTRREPALLNTETAAAEKPIDVVSRGFVDYASRQQALPNLKDLAPTEYSGLHVYCSVDPDLMNEAQRVLSAQIPAIERRFPPARRGTCGGGDDRMLGAIVALDPRTGQIVAMAGGAGGEDGVRYSALALNALGAAASTCKPFWVTEALAGAALPGGGRYTAASVIDPAGASVAGWSPSRGTGGPGRVRSMLSSSRDDFAAYTVGLIGLGRAAGLYRELTGVPLRSPEGPLSIGFGAGAEVSPLALARAYSVYALNGSMPEVSPIGSVYLDGVEQPIARRPPARVADENASFVTAQMLRSVVGHGLDGGAGTARAAFLRTGISPRAEMAGKTGSGPADVWMVSVSPRLVVAVWLGYQCHTEIRGGEGMFAADTAAVAWAEFMRSVNRLRPDLLGGKFEMPGGVVQVPIDPGRGCRSAKGATEFFIKGTEPAPCGGGGLLQIRPSRRSGLATSKLTLGRGRGVVNMSRP